jgi:uncharacterized protein (DUF488 family)
VRTVPASRRMPHFARSALERSLPAHGIAYRHMPELGGLRKPKSDSTNLGWRNVSFRGYADYMQTDAFRKNLDELIELASAAPAAIMCAEAVPWRCHRSLVGDALTARQIHVLDILSATKAQPHSMTPFALVEGDRVTYPSERDRENPRLDFDHSAR